jgi:hypothetical protein
MEAIPSFFEKFFGYWEGDRLVATWSYQNPWRIAAPGQEPEQLDLARILADARPVTQSANSERRLVSVFLYQNGALEEFVKAIAQGRSAGHASAFEAAMAKPLNDILPLWRRYLADIAARCNDLMRIPSSMVLPDRASYERAMGADAGRLGKTAG